MLHRLRVAWRVLRAEGAGGFRDRTLDHRAEAARRRAYVPLPPGWRPEAPIPVLLVTSAPPVPWLGGVPSQLRTRLAAEERLRPVALLYPTGSAWRLEVRAGTRRWFLEMPGAAPSPFALEDAGFEQTVRAARERVGAHAVHAEGLAGLPPASLLHLAREGPLLLSLHDFAAFCPRPHLIEEPVLRFCHYSTDPDRCARCLAETATWQGTRRALTAELLTTAAAVVFPSDFLRQIHGELFPGVPADARRRWCVVEPPIASTSSLERRTPGPLHHAALVGSVQPHKGAAVFAETVRLLEGEGLRWSAYGGGDAEHLATLRRLGVRVRGYYRAGSLPERLRRDGVDVALLLSVWPEAHNLVLSECVAAGVPVVAFDLGALGERVPRLGAGRLVTLEQGAAGIAAALRAMQRDGLPKVPAAVLTGPEEAAAALREVYGALGLLALEGPFA
ncbi:MAG TPA: hypothetical protein DD490_34965 [Acidobacteria bacterium]|nr:hypothetical protein [Acidobacteriota bacterium]